MSRRAWLSDDAVIYCLAAGIVLIHLFANRGYGYFRDEFYFMAAGEHLDWGYVDFPLIVALIAWLSRALFGDSLSSIRLFPALAAGLKVILTGLIARELGGGRYARFLAAIAVVVAPIYLGIDNFLSMNAFDPIFWMGTAYALIRILNGADPRMWLVFGLFAGLGLENKDSMLFFGAAIAAGLMLTPQRRLLRDKWFWLGGLVALAVASPNIIWQAVHGWPFFEQISNVKASGRNTPVTPLSFFNAQILQQQPFSFPIWAAGLWFFFARPEGRRYRCLGWAYVVAFALFVALGGKVYYLAPIYPMLFAAGAIVIERFIERRRLGWMRPAYAALLVVGGAITAPFALPILPVETFIRYQRFIGLEAPRTETRKLSALPQQYADMFGWEEMTATVARVYNSLPPDERAKAAILTTNYGEAGAIDFFGPRYGLPKAISGHMNYWLWGPRDYTGEIVIAVGDTAENYKRYFGSVETVAMTGTEYSMPDEHAGVFLCRGLKVPLKQAWPRVKKYR
jgi:hypothetical protein